MKVRRRLTPILALSALLGCSSERSEHSALVSDGARPDAELADARPSTDDGAAPPDAAASGDATSQADATAPRPLVAVIDTLGFATESAPGVAQGFDVDGRVSDSMDALGCSKPDQLSPEGQPGIDNALARLVPLFVAFGLGAAESLAQSLILEGGLLLVVQVDGLDDPENDEDVVVRIRAAQGEPLLGTDGRLLAGQTFDVHPDSPDSTALGAHVRDGVLEAGPFEARLPILAFGLRYDLSIRSARLRARLLPDGSLVDGIFGGGIPLEDLRRIGEVAARDDQSVLPAVEAVFRNAGDLAPDETGACQQVSAALTFSALTAYFYQ